MIKHLFQVYLSYGSLTRLIWTSDNVTLLHILKVQLSEYFTHLHIEGLVSAKLRLFQLSTNLTAEETDEALKMRLKTVELKWVEHSVALMIMF